MAVAEIQVVGIIEIRPARRDRCQVPYDDDDGSLDNLLARLAGSTVHQTAGGNRFGSRLAVGRMADRRRLGEANHEANQQLKSSTDRVYANLPRLNNDLNDELCRVHHRRVDRATRRG